MIPIIQYKDINKKLYIPFDINTNSKLYKDGNVIHKIPHRQNLFLAKVIEYIYYEDFDSIIKILNYICDEDELVGYSFKYYNNYKSLFKNKNRNLKLKYEDSLKIIEIFNEMIDSNIIYNDFQLCNVLLNKKTNDIKVCDIDSIILSNSKEKKILCLKELSYLILAYLYSVNTYDIEICLREKYELNKDNLINKYFDLLKEGKLVDFSKTLEKLDLDLIEEEKRHVKYKAKSLYRNPYYEKKYFGL